MAPVQTTYNTTHAAAFLGQVADMQQSNIVSGTVEDALGIGFALLACQGTDDNGIKAATALGVTVGAVAALGAGNSAGNGTFSAPTVAAGTKPGDWTIEFDDATHFVVSDPDGNEVGKGTAGVAYAGIGPNFTFTAGGTAQVAGDTFKDTVTQTGGGKVKGITVRDDTLAPANPDTYPQYGSAGYITEGSIWVTAGATVAPEDDVWFVPGTGRFTNVAGTTNVSVPHAKFKGTATNGNLVLVHIHLN